MTEGASSAAGPLWRATGGDFWRDLIPDVDDRAARNRVDSSAVDEEIRDLFLTEAGLMIGRLLPAPAAADSTTIRNVAHSLQGTGGAVGMPEISALGEALSLAARAADWPRCAALIDRLRQWHTLNTAPSA
ncbi:MAG: Hpt domain-containing protein [Verrucomicrobia bacterium]|nr:Hpt domain-containing protein [Verrucomicrobiota bacterium]